MITEKDTKVDRILTINSKLVHGEIINKKDMTEQFNVNKKTIRET